jgi:hypothetical protein
MTTAATLLLGVLLAQGHGTKAAGGAKKAGAARGGEVQRRAAPTSTSASTSTSSSSSSASSSTSASASAGGGSAGGDRSGASDEGTKTAVAEGGGGAGKNFKSKTYNFGAMDVEGKLKTPQLLYFLNRVKLELDMSAPDTRSFMKELEKSADDKNL